MRDLISEFLDALEEEYGINIDPNDFYRVLDSHDLMIVPAEDPTNLRYGVEDDE